MLDANLIAALETSLQQTRSNQGSLVSRLREVENEAEILREEIATLENTAEQTASVIDTLLVAMRSGNRSVKLDKAAGSQNEYPRATEIRPANGRVTSPPQPAGGYNRSNSVTYLNQNRGVAARNATEPISHRFSDRTITQACTLLLREAGKPLHVNELYHLLVAGGMQFKGNNPTISVAVSLNRNRRFRKVDPGTFDLVMREAAHREAS